MSNDENMERVNHVKYFMERIEFCIENDMKEQMMIHLNCLKVWVESLEKSVRLFGTTK
jgi:hypothetical protein